MVYANLNGPVKASINIGGDANYVAVRLPENAKYAGARITVNKMDGSLLSDAYVIGEGLASDQTATVTFGLGVDTSVKSIDIRLPDGTSVTLNNPEINKMHRL